VERYTADGLIDRFVAKYRAGRIASVIHLRRILEASEAVRDARTTFIHRLAEFVDDETLETRAAFDEFVADTRRTQSVLRACEQFVTQVQRARIEHVVENRHEVMRALDDVRVLVHQLLDSLEGEDPTAAAEQERR